MPQPKQAGSGPAPRVVRRKEKTRERLTRAAWKLIAEKGVEGLRLREIAEAADVGFGSFYNYFPSKEALVEAVSADLVEEISTDLIRRVEQLDDPAESGCAAHRWFVRQAVERPQTAWLIVNLSRSGMLLEDAVAVYAKPLLERGIATGRFRDLDVDTTLTYVTAATIGVTRGVLEGRLGADAEEESARTLLGLLGLDPKEAADLARRPLPWERDPR